MKQLKSKSFAYLVASIALLFVFSLNAQSASAQTKKSKKSASKKSSSKKTTAKKSTKKSSSKKSEITGRLPHHYGKLELKDEQREKIYKIQAKYADKIAKLQKELDALKGKVDTESQKVLTTTQRRNLAKFKAEAAKARK